MAEQVYMEMAREDFDGEGFYVVKALAQGAWRSSEPVWCGSEEEVAENLEEAAGILDRCYGFYGNLYAAHMSDEWAVENGYM